MAPFSPLGASSSAWPSVVATVAAAMLRLTGKKGASAVSVGCIQSVFLAGVTGSTVGGRLSDSRSSVTSMRSGGAPLPAASVMPSTVIGRTSPCLAAASCLRNSQIQSNS